MDWTIGSLHDPVTWHKINHAGTQVSCKSSKPCTNTVEQNEKKKQKQKQKQKKTDKDMKKLYLISRVYV